MRPVHDPPGHGVDVVTDNVTANPVGLDKRSPASHKWVGDGYAFQIVRSIEGFLKRFLAVFGENKAAKKSSWPPGEPFVNRNDGAVILLDLLLSQGEGGYERYIEAFFDRHAQVIGFFRWICNAT